MNRPNLAFALALLLWSAPVCVQADQRLTFKPSFTSRPCQLFGYRGTCFYDETGEAVYWILRKMENGKPIGPGLLGFASLSAKQQIYNQWVLNDIDANLEIDLMGLIDFVTTPRLGWAGDRFRLPFAVGAIGLLDGDTLRIPYFRTGVSIIRLWHDYQKDCREASGSATLRACGLTLNEASAMALPESDYPEPRFVFQVRADQLREAYDLSQSFGQELSKAGVSDSEPIAPDTLPQDMVERASEIHEKLLWAIKDAEGIRDAYRASR